ncbi:MAG: hypothetical protein ABUT20_39910, partial [Bacteroidota bacterium]
IIRPNAEAATKATFGKLFSALPFETTKAISDRAKVGGESSSWKSIAKGYQAYFYQMGEKTLEARYNKADKAYDESATKYYDQKSKTEGIKIEKGEDSKEYKDAAAELKPLKEKMDSNLVDAVGNVMYKYIGGSSLGDAWQTLLHRTSAIEKKFGHFDEESFKGFQEGKNKFGTAVDNLEYLGNFIGRSHSALKTFSGRYSFAAGFMGRLEGAVADGIDISKPEKILEIANESYLDWDRGKYQESNPISDGWNKITSAVEKISPSLSYIMKSDVAITRVPVNMIREAVMEYTIGAFTAPVMAAREYYKAKGIVLKDGYTPESAEAFKKDLSEQLRKIDPNDAARIARAFRKGGFGLGMYALALTGAVAFGGWGHKGQTADDKKKKKIEEETGEKQLLINEIEILGKKVPEWAEHVIGHAPSAAPLLFATGLYGTYDNAVKNGEIAPEAAREAVMAQLDHIVNSIPQSKIVTPIVKDLSDRFNFTTWDAVNKDGIIEKRKVFRADDYMSILHGHKDQLLTPANFKIATKIQNSYKKDIGEVERNKELSKEEKEKQIKELRGQMKADIDAVYVANQEDDKNEDDDTGN